MWIIKRTVQAFATLWAAVSISFALFRLMPGGPIDYMRASFLADMSSGGSGSGVNLELLNQRIQTYTNINPDDPLHVQYVEYMVRTLQLDLGRSIWYQSPVLDIMARALPWTILLTLTALLVAFSFAIVLGAAMAYTEGSKFDFTMSSVSIFLTSIPFYIFAVVLLAVFAFNLGWFPTKGRVDPNLDPSLSVAYVASIVHYAILPIAALVITRFGGWALSMRGNSIRILGEDYERVARLRGIPRKVIVTRYVGRNAILPMYTSLMISIGAVFGGSIILERIFTYPGMGWYMYKAFQTRDYPLLMGGFILITAGIIIGVYIADLTYGMIDPRVKGGEGREAF